MLDKDILSDSFILVLDKDIWSDPFILVLDKDIWSYPFILVLDKDPHLPDGKKGFVAFQFSLPLTYL